MVRPSLNLPLPEPVMLLRLLPLAVLVLSVVDPLAPAARAQTAVVVNRQALVQEVEELGLDIDALEQLNAGHPNARVKGRVAAGLGSMRTRLARLKAVLEAAPSSRDRPAPPPVVVVTPPPMPAPPVVAAPVAMDAARFAELTADIKKAAFADAKVALVRDAVEYHHFTVDQVVVVMGLMAMGGDKMEAAAAMHPRVVNRQDFFKVYKHLAFSSDQDDLRARVGR